MSRRYFAFKSLGLPVNSIQTTTRWPESVACKITLGGFYGDDFYHLQIMDGPNEDINTWASENPGKLAELNAANINAVGRSILPVDTELIIENADGEMITHRVTGYDIETGVSLEEVI